MFDNSGTGVLNGLLQKVEQDTPPTVPVGITEAELVEMGEDFDFDGFQVVRREFFAHMREPSITFNKCKFYVNAACLMKFADHDYAQVLVNKESKILALRPCDEGAKDSFQWCTRNGSKRKPKPITCKLFFAKIVSLMDWNPEYRYKMLGKVVHSNNEYLLVFDLTATEVYKCTYTEGSKPKMSRTPVFPAEWQNQFGLPYNEHKKSMQINVFDGYAVYAIKEAPPIGNTENVEGAEQIKAELEVSNNGESYANNDIGGLQKAPSPYSQNDPTYVG